MGHNQESSADLCFHTMDVLMCYGVFVPVKYSFLVHACLVFVVDIGYMKSCNGLCSDHVIL